MDIPTLSSRFTVSNSHRSGALRTEDASNPFTLDDERDDLRHEANTRGLRQKMDLVNWRSVLSLAIAIVLVIVFVVPLVGLPISSYFSGEDSWYYTDAMSIGVTGHDLTPGGATLIDPETPSSVFTRTGIDGSEYELVFSDEFNTAGRTFYEGDDPYWEAVDLHYGSGSDLEWFDPAAVTTRNGSLVIILEQTSEHGQKFRSGMLQGWNKFCFTGAYVEVSVLLPGEQISEGYWPAAWMMGNLARPGYGGSTEGVWPYSYDSCDVGTFPNQTNTDRITPAAAQTSGGTASHGVLSYLPGQRLSACTCLGEDHPGPNVGVGRGAPEIDIFAAERSMVSSGGQVFQAAVFAPFAAGYQYPQGATQTFNDTSMSPYIGSVSEQTISALTPINANSFQNAADPTYAVFGVEYTPNDGQIRSISWVAGGQRSWGMSSGAVTADAKTEISERLISEEPMALVLNLRLSEAFQSINSTTLVFPAELKFDYVRVYQRKGQTSVGCDPTDHPTAGYIQNHLNAYQNPNITNWSQAGYSFPKNGLLTSC